jgi:hypothetical protein
MFSSSNIIVAGVGWVVLGFAVAIAAALRGRPFWAWLLYSVAFWPLAIYHLLFTRPRNPDVGPLDEDQV